MHESQENIQTLDQVPMHACMQIFSNHQIVDTQSVSILDIQSGLRLESKILLVSSNCFFVSIERRMHSYYTIPWDDNHDVAHTKGRHSHVH